AGIAVLDDALQYGDVARDLEVVVVDARWPTGGGPIPVGTGRVPISWLRRADVVWVNHGSLPRRLAKHLRPDAVVVEATYKPVGWLYRGERLPLDALPPRPAVAFAGIARPEGFFRLLRRVGVRLERTWVFPDHHAYVWGDLHGFEAWMDDHVVLTTEKDAARLPPDAQVRALLLEPEIVAGREALEAKLAAVAARVKIARAG
ncbi:MAG: tetraacyldisaccharide 4'-kinase, partial [Myxococcota bacterium]